MAKPISKAEKIRKLKALLEQTEEEADNTDSPSKASRLDMKAMKIKTEIQAIRNNWGTEIWT
jgi:hypothetical protein